MSDEEKTLEMKDENREAEVQETEATGPEMEAGAEKEETQEGGIPGLPNVDVYSLLGTFVSVLSMHVWHWMGLMKNPATGEMDKDLAQAKVAIDTIAALAVQLEGKIGPAEQKELQGLLNDLRINFVQQSAKP